MDRGLLHRFGNVVRSVGDGIHKVADALQLRPVGLINKRCGHRRLITVGERKPVVNQGAWIAPTASVIGSVLLGVNSTVWYGAVLRGDIHHIKVGVLSHIGDRCVVHVSSGKVSGEPKGTIIGSNVVVEPGAILHACTIEDGVKIGSGSVIFDGAVIGQGAQVAPGSVVPQGKKVPAGELWSGNPAKFERKLNSDEIDEVQSTSESFYTLAKAHDHESSKSEYEILAEREYETAIADIWWGQTTQKSGVAQEHKTIKNYIRPNRENAIQGGPQ